MDTGHENKDYSYLDDRWERGRKDKIKELKKENEELKQRLEAGQHETIVICQFMKRMSEKHEVEIDDLNIHSTYGQLHVQKYTPGGLHEFLCLETLDMEGI